MGRVALPAAQQQNVATTVASAAADAEQLSEKEVMSRAYNEQMQKQMGWNNPYVVRACWLHLRAHLRPQPV